MIGTIRKPDALKFRSHRDTPSPAHRFRAAICEEDRLPPGQSCRRFTPPPLAPLGPALGPALGPPLELSSESVESLESLELDSLESLGVGGSPTRFNLTLAPSPRPAWSRVFSFTSLRPSKEK